jgi:parallel beta-helix repeat protein
MKRTNRKEFFFVLTISFFAVLSSQAIYGFHIPQLSKDEITGGVANIEGFNENIKVYVSVEFSEDKLLFDNVLGYDTIYLKGCDILSDIGKPMLPQKHLMIALPSGMKVTRVKNVQVEEQEIFGTFTIFPAQPPQPMNQARDNIDFIKPNSSIYESDALYPPEIITFISQIDIAGQAIAKVLVYPIRYIPSEKKLILSKSIEFVLEGSKGYEYGDYLPYIISETGKKSYEKMIKDMVINPNDVQLALDPRGPSLSRSLPSEGPYDHVIICRNADSLYWQTLANWHTQRGLKDIIVTTSYISNNYAGSDIKEKIRNFIVDAHSTWGTISFLLCGENSDIPFAYRTYKDDSIPSDQFYGDYDDDWLYEVFVGRSTARGSTEVNRFIDKVLKYEKDPPLTNYPLDVTLLGMDITTYSSHGELTRGEYLKERIESWYIPPRFSVTEVYDTDSGNHKTAFLSALNDGQNLVNHNDHCNDWVMGTGYMNHGWSITNNDVDALTNSNRMSNIYSIGCWANAMDDPNGYDCIAEHFVLYNSYKAGVSFTGNTRSGWFYVGYPFSLSCQLDQYWWEGLFSYNYYTLGETLAYTKNSNPTSPPIWLYCQWTLNLLGEPAMPLWTDTPSCLNVTQPLTLPVGTSTVLVHVEDDGEKVENAYVCLLKENDVYEREYTNSNGDAVFNVSSSSPGPLKITVTKHNYLPYESTLEVTLPDRVFVDDDYTSTTPGWGIDHYKTIQDGIKGVAEHGTVYVYSGIYYENIFLNKTITLKGEHHNTTSINGDNTGTVVSISADKVNLSGFTITNNGSYHDSGIEIHTNQTRISCNRITPSSIQCILLNQAEHNTITSNTLSDAWRGIHLEQSSYNTIVNNTITNMMQEGTLLGHAEHNTGNRLYHNNILNTSSNAVDLGMNLWNNSYPSGGNFWDDYDGVDRYHGVNQDIFGSDGIGDTPYNITGGTNKDHYPLMKKWGDTTYTIALSTQWNCMSLPFNQTIHKENISVRYNGTEYNWIQATTNDNPTNEPIILEFLYTWNRTNQGYDFADTLEPGYGYWVYAYQPCTLGINKVGFSIEDTVISDRMITWNIVGAPFEGLVFKENLIIHYNGTEYTWHEAVNNSIILGFIYGWDQESQSYEFIEVLDTTHGYWMYTYYECKLLHNNPV